MPNVVISLSKNKLKASVVVSKNVGKVVSREIFTQVFELPNEVANDTRILDSAQFASAVSDLVAQLVVASGNRVNPKKVALTFLTEPKDEILKFVTVNKTSGDTEAQVIAEINSKLTQTKIEDLYFTYSKVAPFVYQFVGVEKSLLDKYLEISNLLQVELRGVFPWVMFLPKYTGGVDPAIYVSNSDGRQVVALSELGGIYYSSAFNEERSTAELEQMVHELSIYKRSTPINKIFSLDEFEFTLDPTYELAKINLGDFSESPEIKGFENHLVVDSMLESDPQVFSGIENLLNLLPLPVVVNKKNTSLVYVGGGAALVVLLLGIFGGVYYFGGKITHNSNNANVLSESDSKVDADVTPTPTPTPVATPVLNRVDLKVRIENGSGIPGAAGKAQTKLQALGYTVPDIGNAVETDKPTTSIKIKTTKLSYKDLLIADLKSDYELVVEDGLNETTEYDVLMVVGQK